MLTKEYAKLQMNEKELEFYKTIDNDDIRKTFEYMLSYLRIENKAFKLIEKLILENIEIVKYSF